MASATLRETGDVRADHVVPDLTVLLGSLAHLRMDGGHDQAQLLVYLLAAPCKRWLSCAISRRRPRGLGLYRKPAKRSSSGVGAPVRS